MKYTGEHENDFTAHGYVDRRPRAAPTGIPLIAMKVLGWPKKCKLSRAFPWEYRYKRLQLAQLLSQLGIFLTYRRTPRNPPAAAAANRRSRLDTRPNLHPSCGTGRL